MFLRYEETNNSIDVKQFHMNKWPPFDVTTEWSEFKRLWVIPVIEEGIPLKYIANKLYAVLPQDTRLFIANSVKNRNDVQAVMKCMDLMHQASATGQGQIRNARVELDACERAPDEVIDSFARRLLHLVANAHPMQA
jgi:hypothetical protein